MMSSGVLLAQSGPEPSSGKSSFPDSVAEVQATLTETLGGVWSDFLGHLPYLAGGLVVVIATWIIANVAVRVARRLLKTRKKMRASLQELFLRFLSIGLWFAGLMLAAMIVFPGLTPAKALGGLGLLSIAVGFAFKDIFENFFAGILLLWRFPFETGDVVECEGVYGRVERVEIRMTQIRKTTGELVVVPNAFLFKNAVEVITSRPLRRVHLTAGVAYGENVGKAISVIKEAVSKCRSAESDHPVEICAKAFGASSVDIDVAWWTHSAPGRVRHSTSEVVEAIKSALDEAGIEIPFPYRTLTFADSIPIEMSGEENSLKAAS